MDFLTETEQDRYRWIRRSDDIKVTTVEMTDLMEHPAPGTEPYWSPMRFRPEVQQKMLRHHVVFLKHPEKGHILLKAVY